jgi:hypothetical protein
MMDDLLGFCDNNMLGGMKAKNRWGDVCNEQNGAITSKVLQT